MSELLNGTAAPKEPFKADPRLVAFIETLLSEVKIGRITSIATITVSPMGQIAWPGFGFQAAELYIGAQLMGDDMRIAFRGGAKGGNKIITPR